MKRFQSIFNLFQYIHFRFNFFFTSENRISSIKLYLNYHGIAIKSKWRKNCVENAEAFYRNRIDLCFICMALAIVNDIISSTSAFMQIFNCHPFGLDDDPTRWINCTPSLCMPQIPWKYLVSRNDFQLAKRSFFFL